MKIFGKVFVLLLILIPQTQARIKLPFAPAIYGGIDDRTPVHLHKDLRLREMAKSVVYLKRIEGNRYFTCSGTIFNYNGKDYLITARHCIKTQEYCDNTTLVRNFRDDVKIEEQIYNPCNKLILANEELDLAVTTYSLGYTLEKKIKEQPKAKDENQRDRNKRKKKKKTIEIKNKELERVEVEYETVKVPYLEPIPSLPLEFSESDINTPLTIIGHPLGIAKRITDNCSVLKFNLYKFSHQCDTFSGNSGSPTFNLRDYKFTGILVSGRPDESQVGKEIYYSRGYESSLDSRHFGEKLIRYLDGDIAAFDILVNKLSKTIKHKKSDLIINYTEDRNLDVALEIANWVSHHVDTVNPDTLDTRYIYFKESDKIENSTGLFHIKSGTSFFESIKKIESRIDWVSYLNSMNTKIGNILVLCQRFSEFERCKKVHSWLPSYVEKNYEDFRRVGIKKIAMAWDYKTDKLPDELYIDSDEEREKIESWLNQTLHDLPNDIPDLEEKVEINNHKLEYPTVNNIRIEPNFGTHIHDEGYDQTFKMIESFLKENPKYNRVSLDIYEIRIGGEVEEMSRSFTLPIGVGKSQLVEIIEKYYTHQPN